jgi:hypothetical protein
MWREEMDAFATDDLGKDVFVWVAVQRGIGGWRADPSIAAPLFVSALGSCGCVRQGGCFGCEAGSF